MPYVIELSNDRDTLRFPTRCPYCLGPEARERIEVRYSKPLAILPTSAFAVFISHESRFRFPACGHCAKRVRLLGKLAPPIALVPVTAMVFALFLNWPYVDWFIYAAIVGAALAGAMLCYRQWIQHKFKVGYLGTNSALLYARYREYAQEFAQLNHVPMKFRWLVLRWF
jgi:hypothetical protein